MYVKLKVYSIEGKKEGKREKNEKKNGGEA